jgi:hypothetical protein
MVDEMTPLRILATFFVALSGGALGYSVIDRELPVIVLEKGAVSEIAPRGTIWRAKYRFFRKRECYTHIDRFIFDADGVRHVLSDLEFVAGALPLGEDKATVSALIPATAAIGPATYVTINCYECNFTHRIWPLCAPARDIKFNITE